MGLGNDGAFLCTDAPLFAYDQHIAAAIQVAGQAYRNFDAKGLGIGGRKLHLSALPFRSQHCHILHEAFVGNQTHPLVGKEFPGLAKHLFGSKPIALAEQFLNIFDSKVHVPCRNLHQNAFSAVSSFRAALGSRLTQ